MIDGRRCDCLADANTEPPAVKRRRKGRPGVARKLPENPDATVLR
jgi:hypothetical protein